MASTITDAIIACHGSVMPGSERWPGVRHHFTTCANGQRASGEVVSDPHA